MFWKIWRWILNGKRNGKGKEYNDKGQLKFEGEYLNGDKWNGKFKEYDDDGQLEFEGDYINGKRKRKKNMSYMWI